MKPGPIKPAMRPKPLSAAYIAPGEDADMAAYTALARLLRYAHSEALSQNREKAARFIEAAIISLPETTPPSQQ